MKKIVGVVLFAAGSIHLLRAQQVTSFNFTKASQPVAGWINVTGDPSLAVRTATDPASGISVSSIATANWAPYTNGTTAYDGGGASGGTFFPAAVMINHWFQYGNSTALYNALLPQLQISGLNKDSTYTFKMTGSFIPSGNFNMNPMRYTVSGATLYGYIDVNGNSNTANGAVFYGVVPDSNGKVRIYVNTFNTSTVASICGLVIIRGSNPPLPSVTITHPQNGDVIPEDGDKVISANATETGGAIAQVEFYVNENLIGTASSAPYSATWHNPDQGNYVLKAKAIDGLGNSNSASINVSIEPLSSYWSMTGNIGMNPDSNFVGNVDSVRLAFRTRNIERMSISPLGNIGIGTINPTAQLHTTGSVRFAGIVSDTTKTRVLVTDSAGNLSYRLMDGLSGQWQKTTGLTYNLNDNIGIGTSNTQGYKLAVNGSAIFTKIKVKPVASWPDYVFRKNYTLPKLSDIEEFITTHHHLPDIVSEQEQQEQGIDLGATEAVLLKKIEELTLYLIEQDKVIRDQHLLLKKQAQEIKEIKKIIQKKK